jgi:hypothetical protein
MSSTNFSILGRVYAKRLSLFSERQWPGLQKSIRERLLIDIINQAFSTVVNMDFALTGRLLPAKNIDIVSPKIPLKFAKQTGGGFFFAYRVAITRQKDLDNLVYLLAQQLALAYSYTSDKWLVKNHNAGLKIEMSREANGFCRYTKRGKVTYDGFNKAVAAILAKHVLDSLTTHLPLPADLAIANGHYGVRLIGALLERAGGICGQSSACLRQQLIKQFLLGDLPGALDLLALSTKQISILKSLPAEARAYRNFAKKLRLNI